MVFNAVIVVVAEVAVVMVAVEGPLTCVHNPVPMDGAFAAMVAVAAVKQIV